jgi:hypothetical protein
LLVDDQLLVKINIRLYVNSILQLCDLHHIIYHPIVVRYLCHTQMVDIFRNQNTKKLITGSKSTCSNEIDRPLVEGILHESEKNNQERESSGVLLAAKKHYLQVIEGEY